MLQYQTRPKLQLWGTTQATLYLYSMNNLSLHTGDPFVFIFLMAYSMHNDLSRRIQRLLLRIALNNTAAPCVASEMKCMPFFKLYRSKTSCHLNVWLLSFRVQISLTLNADWERRDKWWKSETMCKQVLWDLNSRKCRVTWLKMCWPSSGASATLNLGLNAGNRSS